VSGPCPLVLGDPARVGHVAAELVANRLRARPRVRLLLPTGTTPLGMYARLRELRRADALPTEQASLIQLDEYVGLERDDPRSFAAYLDRELADVPFAAFHRLDGAAVNPDAEAQRHQRVLDAAPVDLAVLGLGRDGHVAFDEPGAHSETPARRVVLHPVTREDAAGEFGGAEAVPRAALTVGLRTLLAARELILLVTGSGKAAALHAALHGPRTPGCPASLLREHPRLTVICDRAAAADLRSRPQFASDHLYVVLGHRDPGIDWMHFVSDESFARLARAERLARREPPRAAILTGYTSTTGLSEAEHMQARWPRELAPALLEVAGRNTAENASRCLPIAVAMGEARRVTVVTSAWHLRAPYFFAPYRRHGLQVTHRRSLPVPDWGRLLRREFREAPRARRERRAAMAAVRLPTGR
jgi:glucosamine-6-phosphate deaminase